MEPPLAGMKEPTPNQIRPELRALPGTTRRRRRLGLVPPRPPWNSSIDVRAARSDEHLCIDLIWGAWFVDLILEWVGSCACSSTSKSHPIPKSSRFWFVDFDLG